MKQILIFLFFFVFQKAESSSHVDSLNTFNFNQEEYSDSIYKVNTCLKYKGYCLRVRSTIQDDRVESTNFNFFNPIVLKQELFFFKKGKIIKRLEYPTNKIRLKVLNGSLVEMLENVLWNIGVVEGSKGALYVLSGDGGCNSCSEFSGLYSLDGQVLWYGYASINEFFGGYGDLTEVLKKYNIPDSLIQGPRKYKNITVYKNHPILFK